MPIRTYKIRFYPTRDQDRALAHWFGQARFARNWGLDARQKAYRRRGERANSAALGKTFAHLWVLGMLRRPGSGAPCARATSRDRRSRHRNEPPDDAHRARRVDLEREELDVDGIMVGALIRARALEVQ